MSSFARRASIGLFLAVVAFAASAVPAGAAAPLYLGAYVGPRAGESSRQAFERFESQIGRPLAVARVYDLWDTPFPDSYDNWLRNSDHILALSVKARRMNGNRVMWSDIAAAQPGSALYNDMVSWASRIKAFGGPVWFSFNHEPEAATNDGNGNATQFIAAWRRFVTVMRSQGLTNVKYVWSATDYAFWRTDGRRAELWYPGDAYVDAIAADAYNWSTCRPGVNTPWWSLEQIVDPLRRFGQVHPDEELMLLEFASYEDPLSAGRKAQWFNAVRQLFGKPGWEQFTAALAFDTYSQHPTCLWPADSTASSLTAFRALAADPLFGRMPGDVEPPPPPPPDPTSVLSESFSGGLGAWTTSGGASLDASIGGLAAPSLRLQGTSSVKAQAARSLGGTYGQGCLSLRVRLSAIGPDPIDLFRLRTTADGPIIRVYAAPDRTLLVRADASGVQLSSGVQLPLNAWRSLEFCGTVGTASAWSLSLEGTTIVPAWTTSTGTTPIGLLQLGDSAKKSFIANLDDVVFTTGTGTGATTAKLRNAPPPRRPRP
jgi:hypothetical protein